MKKQTVRVRPLRAHNHRLSLSKLATLAHGASLDRSRVRALFSSSASFDQRSELIETRVSPTPSNYFNSLLPKPF